MGYKIEGVSSLKAKLKKLETKYGKESVSVGFTQKYALHVHEIQAHHRVGQWKYLETPARAMKAMIGKIVADAMKRGMTLLQSLMFGGLRLQREAQQITPVDTSALKASAFTCPTKDVEAVSSAAYAKSEATRVSELASRKP